MELDKIDKSLLAQIADLHKIPEGSYNIRKNGECIARNTSAEINIIPKADKSGIDIYVAPKVKNKSCHIPVILSQIGIKDVVYNDFYIGEDADVTIVAGCGIDCNGNGTSEHDGIHTFHLSKNCKVKYIEKHIGVGDEKTKKVLNPQTKITMKENSYFDMQTIQLGGVSYSDRKTFATLEENAKLNITEKILTTDSQKAKTTFKVVLKGKNSTVDVVSRSVAKNKSQQEFISNIVGNNVCFGHVECDAIIVDRAKVTSTPKIQANNVNASLVHEAVIGKIAGEQLTKLMSLGMTSEQAEDVIINGYLK